MVTPNLHEACALAGVRYSDDANREELAGTIHALGASAVIVTGGHGPRRWTGFYDWRAARSDFGRASRLGRDPRRRLHPLREPHGPSRPRRALEDAARGAARASPQRPCGAGSAGIGAGSSPVDVLNLEAVRSR